MKFPSLFILLTLIFAGCAGNSAKIITVSAAVSLKDAFNEIGESYKNKTGNVINFNFGASGALQRQIENGAPVDVFASAGEKQMDELAAKDLIDKNTRRDFASNTLVLIAPKNSDLSIKDFNSLNELNVKKIAVGNPKTVPAGQYADQVFEKMNLKTGIADKLILAEDVRQVLDYVERGEVDAGVVYQTDANMSGDKVKIITAADETAHSPILYPIALIKDGSNKQTAQAFLDFVISAEGQMILQKYGFSAVAQK